MKVLWIFKIKGSQESAVQKFLHQSFGIVLVSFSLISVLLKKNVESIIQYYQTKQTRNSLQRSYIFARHAQARKSQIAMNNLCKRGLNWWRTPIIHLTTLSYRLFLKLEKYFQIQLFLFNEDMLVAIENQFAHQEETLFEGR